MTVPAQSEVEIDRLWHSVRDDLRRHGADAETAEDIVQDTWLIALHRPPKELGHFRGWLHVVAMRRWRRWRRRERERLQRALFAETLPEAGAPPADGQEVSRLRRAVEELAEPYRVPLRLRFFEGLEVEEIALRLGLKPSTVYTRIRRGLLRLRERVEPEERRALAPLAWLARLGRWARGHPRPMLRGLGAAVLLAVVLPILLRSVAPARSAAPSGPMPLSASRVESLALTLPPQAFRSIAPREEPAEAPLRALEGVRIAGIVLAPDGTRAARARVFAADFATPHQARTTVTDTTGRFELVADGELLWATHEDWCESPRRYVASILTLEHVEIHLSPTRGRVGVEVRSPTGLPVVGAEIRVGIAGRTGQWTLPCGALEVSGALPRGVTDADGRCSLLLPEQPETEFLVLPPGQPGWRGTLPTPSATELLTLELPAPLELTGTCRNEAQEVLEHARVEVIQLAGLVRRETRTDDAGRFRLEGLGPGDFALRACGSDWPPLSAWISGSMRTDERAEFELVLREEGSLFGCVVEDGLPQAGLRVELSSGSLHAAEDKKRVTVTDGQGRFAFAGCAAKAHDLQVFRPGAGASCFGASGLRPGADAMRCVLPPEDAPRAAVELSFSGATTPTMVELRRVLPAESWLFDLGDSASEGCRSAPLPGGEYHAFAWSRELGTWALPPFEHDPRAPVVHAFVTPEHATLAVELELPEGVAREDLRVQLLVPSFHRSGLDYRDTHNAWRTLPWSEREAAYVGAVVPGEHFLAVRGRGLSECQRRIELAAGSLERIALHLRPGTETTLFFEFPTSSEPTRTESGGLELGESIRLEALTPTGSELFELRWRDQLRVEGGFEFRLGLPDSTSELRARTRSRLAPDSRREGRCVLAPDALSVAGRPRLRIPLVGAR